MHKIVLAFSFLEVIINAFDSLVAASEAALNIWNECRVAPIVRG